MMNQMRTTYRPDFPLQSLAVPNLGQATGFEARLSLVPTMVAPEPELTLQRAFETLVSAACYLSLAATGEPAAMLEAVQMLHDLSQEMQGDGLDLSVGAGVGAAPDDVEDRIWQDKQRKWERWSAAHAAMYFKKNSSGAQYVSSRPARSAEPRFWLTRWWSTWQGVPRVQPF